MAPSPVDLPVQRWGEGPRRVLLVHGLASSSSVWWRVASDLADRGWLAVAPDLRGHGHAPHTVSYLMADMTADLAALGGGWDVAVGHSMGGPIVAGAALDPGFARSVTLLDPALEFPDDRWASTMSDLIGEYERQDPREIQAANPRWHSEDVALKAAALRATSRYVIERCLVDNHPWDFVDTVRGVGVPCLLLGSDPAEGALLSPGVGRALAREVGGLEYRMAAGCGHSIQRERPDLVVEAVLDANERP